MESKFKDLLIIFYHFKYLVYIKYFNCYDFINYMFEILTFYLEDNYRAYFIARW